MAFDPSKHSLRLLSTFRFTYLRDLGLRRSERRLLRGFELSGFLRHRILRINVQVKNDRVNFIDHKLRSTEGYVGLRPFKITFEAASGSAKTSAFAGIAETPTNKLRTNMMFPPLAASNEVALVKDPPPPPA